ncbi:MAG: hypothetical protein ACK496_20160 [Acidobacteriota bacterium]
MEPLTIASLAIPVLTRFLPVIWKTAKSQGLEALGKITDGLLDKAAESITDKSWETGRKLIEKLTAATSSNPVAQEALQDLAADPDSSMYRDILKLQLQKLLTKDHELMGELAALLKTEQSAGISIVASGDRSVAAQNINAPIMTGDIHGGVRFGGENKTEK